MSSALPRRLPGWSAVMIAGLCLTGLVALWARAQGQALVVDLSNDLVAISTGFTGDNVTLFGATDGAGDVAITVRGPETDVIVRRKDEIAGMWINVDAMTFTGVPGYFDVAASRALDEIAPAEVRARHTIGLENLILKPAEAEADTNTASEQRVGAFRNALIRSKQRRGLYPDDVGEAFILGNRLFRTTLEFPSNVPTGLYRIDTFLIREGKVVDVRSNSLVVSKVGFSASVFKFAYQNAGAYAAVALVLATAAGVGAWLIFREN